MCQSVDIPGEVEEVGTLTTQLDVGHQCCCSCCWRITLIRQQGVVAWTFYVGEWPESCRSPSHIIDRQTPGLGWMSMSISVRHACVSPVAGQWSLSQWVSRIRVARPVPSHASRIQAFFCSAAPSNFAFFFFARSAAALAFLFLRRSCFASAFSSFRCVSRPSNTADRCCEEARRERMS